MEEESRKKQRGTQEEENIKTNIYKNIKEEEARPNNAGKTIK